MGGPKIELVTKDLGVDSHGGRRRRTGTAQARARKAGLRQKRLHCLKVPQVKHRVRAQRASVEAAGVAPKRLKHFRTLAANVAHKHKLGSLEVVMRVGEAGVKDPALTVLQQHWKTLWKIFRNMQHCTAQLQHTWGALWSKLGSNPHKWKSVKGPLAAMVAYLSDLGIDASSLWQWVLPGNTEFFGVAGQAVPRQIPINLEDPYTEHMVAVALEAVYLRKSDAIIARQDGASQGNCVEPLDWTLPHLLTKKFRSQPRLLTGMRAPWQGALPTTSKTRQGVCPACKVPADLDHILWHCQWWTTVEGAIPPEFQSWRKKWTHPAIWTRGVAPQKDVTIQLPPAAFQLATTGQWDSLPSGSVIGTDTTGGPNSSEPSLRLVTARHPGRGATPSSCYCCNQPANWHHGCSGRGLCTWPGGQAFFRAGGGPHCGLPTGDTPGRTEGTHAEQTWHIA